MSPRTKKLGRAFYRQDAPTLARALIGKILVHRVGGTLIRARIVETEAYCGPQDLASHSSKGRTKRTEVMFGPAGHAYVYFIYGMHHMLNIVAGATGHAHAVLLRAAEPLDDASLNLSGPGKLARAFQITRAHNGLDLTGARLFLVDDHQPPPQIAITARINIDYAKHWKDAPLRFLSLSSPAVSAPRPRRS
jgi:DNA-3-methyladenine glycosylase